jgi:hypothetical protein
MSHKKVFIGSLLLISAFAWFGCGEDEGALEIVIKNEADQITQVQVRIDSEDQGTFDLNSDIPTFNLREGGHILGVDFLSQDDKRVSSYAPKIVEIQAGQTERISIKVGPQPGPTGCFSAKDVNFQITQPGQYIPLPDRKSLKATGGRGIVVLGLIEVFDCETGKRTGEIFVSSEYIEDPSIWEFDEKEGKFKGSGSGRFIIYRGRKEEGEVIFEGDYIADPPGNLRAVVNPEDRTLVEFKILYRLEANGKGIYKDHILEGTAVSELKGDSFVVSMDAEVKRRVP